MRIAGSDYFKMIAEVSKVEAQTSRRGSNGAPTSDPLLDSGWVDPLLATGASSPPPSSTGSANGQSPSRPHHRHASNDRSDGGQGQGGPLVSASDSSSSPRRRERGRIHEVV